MASIVIATLLALVATAILAHSRHGNSTPVGSHIGKLSNVALLAATSVLISLVLAAAPDATIHLTIVTTLAFSLRGVLTAKSCRGDITKFLGWFAFTYLSSAAVILMLSRLGYLPQAGFVFDFSAFSFFARAEFSGAFTVSIAPGSPALPLALGAFGGACSVAVCALMHAILSARASSLLESVDENSHSPVGHSLAMAITAKAIMGSAAVVALSYIVEFIGLAGAARTESLGNVIVEISVTGITAVSCGVTMLFLATISADLLAIAVAFFHNSLKKTS